ncbi:hypothetical protein HHK36_015215 [Tetracentron sinense]|uniref:E2F/DP family winged-helix DNA-binding domain-containing protein n=1 Tax=Tetracentron sinense TaxID=13715 RepID=A0A834Z2N1_TETSI|nr:hypothetical protein HHK36_015215 [Tetracentron sinense]
MSSSFSTLPESEARHHTYSRKQKSLGLLCSNFLSLYNRDDVESIGLDDAASRLGVERRRIYDIVNVLESVGVLAKMAKNRYSWKGFGGIPRALEVLKEEAMRENFLNTFEGCNYAKVSDEQEDDGISPDPNIGTRQDKSSPSSVLLKPLPSSKADSRREKSLGLLTQNFVKLFLCSNADLISLDEAARILLGDGDNLSTMRTKVRRLYDIANVLSSINLIEKTHHTESRKPAFRWLRMKEKSKNGSSIAFNQHESGKRAFGTEITNTSFKRNKVVSSIDGKPEDTKMKMQMQMKHEDCTNETDSNQLEQHSKTSSKGFVFGPFTPVSVSKVGDSGNKRVQDWESLATTYRPQYQNQALNDLFTHYTEAWKSWYVEIAEKKPVQQTS